MSIPDNPPKTTEMKVSKSIDNTYTPCPQKNLTVCFLAISQLLLGRIQKLRSVLKTTGSENFKTDLTFEIWPSRS